MFFVNAMLIFLFFHVCVAHPMGSLPEDQLKIQLLVDENPDEKANSGRVTRNTLFITPKFMPIEVDNGNLDNFILQKLEQIEYDGESEEEEEDYSISVVEVSPNEIMGEFYRRSNLEKRDSEDSVEVLHQEIKSNENDEEKIESENADVRFSTSNPLTTAEYSTDIPTTPVSQMFTPDENIDSSEPSNDRSPTLLEETGESEFTLGKTKNPDLSGEESIKVIEDFSPPLAAVFPKGHAESSDLLNKIENTEPKKSEETFVAEASSVLPNTIETTSIVPSLSSGIKPTRHYLQSLIESKLRSRSFLKPLVQGILKASSSKMKLNEMFPIYFKFRQKQ